MHGAQRRGKRYVSSTVDRERTNDTIRGVDGLLLRADTLWC